MGTMVPQHAENVLMRVKEIGILARDAPLTHLPQGTVNTVFRGRSADGDSVYVRIAPPSGVIGTTPSWMRKDALSCEVRVLDRLRRAVPELHVPVPIAAGFRSHEGHWLVQAAMRGKPLDASLTELRPQDRQAMWRQLGSLVQRVHAVEGPWFGTPDGRERFGDWAGMVRADALGLLGDASRFGLDTAPFERLLDEIERHQDALHGVGQPVLIHSDLDPRHVFVEQRDEGWEITGLIDWEYARYADPFSESLLVDLLSRPTDDPERGAFLEGYGIKPDVVDGPAFQARQRMYWGIIAGWGATDEARLATGCYCT